MIDCGEPQARKEALDTDPIGRSSRVGQLDLVPGSARAAINVPFSRDRVDADEDLSPDGMRSPSRCRE